MTHGSGICLPGCIRVFHLDLQLITFRPIGGLGAPLGDLLELTRRLLRRHRAPPISARPAPLRGASPPATPDLRHIPARLIGIGFRPEHAKTTEVLLPAGRR